jgi:hypothetical protein
MTHFENLPLSIPPIYLEDIKHLDTEYVNVPPQHKSTISFPPTRVELVLCHHLKAHRLYIPNARALQHKSAPPGQWKDKWSTGTFHFVFAFLFPKKGEGVSLALRKV